MLCLFRGRFRIFIMCECLGSACLSAAVCLFVCLCSDQSPISLIVSADVFSVSLRACTCMCRGLRGCLDYMSSNFSKSVCLGLHVLFSLPLCPCPIVCLDLSVLFCLSSSIYTSLSALVSFVLELYVGLDICVRLSVSPCMSVCLYVCFRVKVVDIFVCLQLRLHPLICIPIPPPVCLYGSLALLHEY